MCGELQCILRLSFKPQLRLLKSERALLGIRERKRENRKKKYHTSVSCNSQEWAYAILLRNFSIKFREFQHILRLHFEIQLRLLKSQRFWIIILCLLIIVRNELVQHSRPNEMKYYGKVQRFSVHFETAFQASTETIKA